MKRAGAEVGLAIAWFRWRPAAIAALVLMSAMPSWADDEIPGMRARAGQDSGGELVSQPDVSPDDHPFQLMDTRLDYGTAGQATWQMAQATGAPGTTAAPAAASEASANELNKQLSNPVTSLWSLSFQFNNFRLDNGEWNNSLQFQPVLPVGLTRDLNLITRAVIPLYNIVPHQTASGEFEHTVGFGDIVLLELLSPADSGKWILGAGPTFIFPTASSTFTGQGKWRAGPAVVVGYLTDKFIAGVFPQQWWSFAGDADRPDTSQMNLQPFVAWFFGEGWSVGDSGNILANWKASSSERWTVPVGVAVGKVVKLGRLPVKIQLAGQYMPIHPSNVGQEWNIPFQLTPVIPKLIKEPLFR
jgi:hypothetical protein